MAGYRERGGVARCCPPAGGKAEVSRGEDRPPNDRTVSGWAQLTEAPEPATWGPQEAPLGCPVLVSHPLGRVSPGARARGQASCRDDRLACGKGRAWLRASHWMAHVVCCLPAGPRVLCSRQPPINTSCSVCQAARAWGANRRQGTGPLASRAQPLVGGPSQTHKRLDLETECFCGDAPGGHGSPEGQERVREVASSVQALKGK